MPNPSSDPCPICLNKWGGSLREGGEPGKDALRFDCDICGQFVVSRSALPSFMQACSEQAAQPLSPRQRAALSHLIRRLTDADGSVPMLTSDRVSDFLGKDQLPTMAQQAINALRFIGDHIRDTGEPLPHLPDHFFASVGALNPERADQIIDALKERSDLTANDRGRGAAPHGIRFLEIDLTLSGWERYDAERRGEVSGKTGFIAMQFGDPVLDPFVSDVVKPAAAKAGYSLVDMRDLKRAGVIDNLIRMSLRDAAFVVADLSHANNGAYWEAGFAEGLGKPVIYICEKSKFDATKTHFDTNHCTTVMWDAGNTKNFEVEFIATLRNSLREFPSA